MKKLVRLTESDLHRIVKESVNMILETEFKQVDNLNDYIQQNNLQMKPASKFQRVNAQSGKSYINQYGKQNGMDKRQIGRMVRKGGAPLSTVAGDGTQETNNMVTKNHTVLNNVGNTANKWASETPTFARKYEQDPTQQGVYKPKGGPMNATQINEPISFTAPWGERMNVDKGGYILQDPNNPNDVYGISGKDFDSTYRFNEGKNRIRMPEAQLHQIIKESIQSMLDEVAGYKDTMQKAGNNFNQNTFMGRVRSKLQPQKYQQYQRIQQQGNQMGQQAADNINAEREKVPIGMSGGYGPYDRFYSKWASYAKQQGASNHGNRPRPEDYGLSKYPNEWYQERNKENFKQWEKDLEDWDNNIYPNAQKNGKALYNQRIANDQARINKYGTGGRVLKPMDGYDTSSYQDAENAYDQQRQAIKNGQM